MHNRRTFLQHTIGLLGTLAVAPPLPPRLLGANETPPLRNTGAFQLSTSTPVPRYKGYCIGLETYDRNQFDLNAVLPALKKMPVSRARLQSGWARCEPEAGRYDFDWLDGIINAVRNINIEPWLSLGFGNPVYMPECTDPAGVGWVPLYNKAAMAAWINYVKEVARRYRGKIVWYEIWNEPWNEQFWINGPRSGQEYARFAIPTMQAIREIDPNAKFVVGSITLSSASQQYARDFFNAGVADYADALCYHQYARVVDDYYVSKVQKLRALVAEYPRPMEIWQGESGAPSTNETIGVLSNYYWDDQLQAKWTMRREVVEAYAQIDLGSQFHLIDLAARGKTGAILGKPNYKGLLNLDATPKPAFDAFNTMIFLLQGKFPQASKVGDLRLTTTADATFYNFTPQANSTATSMIAYWQRGEFFANNQKPKEVEMTFAAGNAGMLADWALFDPLTHSVYRFNPDVTTLTVPLKDYPLFILKRSQLEAIGQIVS
ncbi:predicted glycoside hydrolase [gamma proteobacterium HdN1]|nr:predicted glycoside hydrolase [gamma proteobacterium HdN1]